MELLSLVLPLRPLEMPAERQEIPRWWGRAVQALFLRVVRERNPELAQELHDEGGLHPYSVSSLMGSFGRDGSLKTDEIYWLRLSGFRADVCQAVWEAAQPGGSLAAGARIELDYTCFEVQAVAEGGERFSPWQSRMSYAQLGMPFLLASQAPPRRVRLMFTSPTTFKSENRHVPLPLPKLVFGSLLERWNAFAPLAFVPETRRYIEACLMVSRYELKTQSVKLKDGGTRVGMTGWVDFGTTNYDRYWMSIIATLGRFALFSGVGAGTGQGLGQCRMAEDVSPA
ncbi:MAG: CRISPR system precrRNA processing endoribonuclease RAMP protein Cas6 [Chloroflexota bacterium]